MLSTEGQYGSRLPLNEVIATPTSSRDLDDLISTPDRATIASLRSIRGRIGVLGAGGKMGFHLCLMLQRALAALGNRDPVIAVSRFGSVRAADEFQAIGCEVHAADLEDARALTALPEIENLFFLAGVKFGTSSDPALLERMNVAMPRKVADRFRDSRFVALSTGCVYSFTSPESGGSREEDATDPPGAYAESCLGREAAFEEAGEKYGTRSALIRLNYSIDLRYGVLVDLAQKVKAGIPIDLKTGYVNVIWQGDALCHTIRSLELADAPPLILNVTGPRVLEVRDLAIGLGERLGNAPVFRGEEQKTAWLNNPAKAHERFGLPKIGIEQMLDWVAAWLLAGGELLGKPTHFETRDGNY